VLGTALGTGLAGVVVSVGGQGSTGRPGPMVVVYVGTAAVALVVALLAGRLRLDRVPTQAVSSTAS
jgi:hypothetical protein